MIIRRVVGATRGRLGRLLALIAALGAVTVVAAAPAGADTTASRLPAAPGPAQVDPGSAVTYSKHHPRTAPPGANLAHCVTRAPHPYPVLLVHGSDGDAYASWSGLSPRLARLGYCVYAVNYGNKPGGNDYGTQDMNDSARQVADAVAVVRKRTGAAQVDVVGYSQGATVSREYIDKLGGAPYVHQWIGLASPTYGGTFYGLGSALAALPFGPRLVDGIVSPAVQQQVQGSAYLAAVNAGGDTVPGVRYTTIGSIYDEVIQPYTNVRLRSPGATNIVIQDLCPIDQTGHFNMPFDPYAQQLVLNALDPAHVAVPPCRFVPLGTGIPGVIVASHS